MRSECAKEFEEMTDEERTAYYGKKAKQTVSN